MSATAGASSAGSRTAVKLALWLSRYWLPAGTVLLALYAGLPWLAPLFMELGWEQAAGAIYLIYGSQCHQLPQRSFFLFGQEAMIPLAEVQAVWQDTSNPVLLRQFVGNAEVGYKVAWSDRMVAMYGSLLVFSLIFWPLRRRLRALPWWGLALLLVPLAFDGFSHMISDLTGGIGGGFRDGNAWLAALTNQAFAARFYTGDALGSFNSWMRLVSGFLFGLGAVWFFYPRLQNIFERAASATELAAQRRDLSPE